MENYFPLLHQREDFFPRITNSVTDSSHILVDGFEHVLAPNTSLIHTSFTYSKWNMDEIFGLKFHLSYTYSRIHTSQKVFIEIPPCAQKVIFITEFAVLGIFMK